MARRELTTLSSGERQQLVNLMLQYITDNMLAHHEHILHMGAQLLDGHRHLIGDMETWLTQNGGRQFVPIPKWDPSATIPAELNVVKPTDDGQQRPSLENLSPNKTLPQAFRKPALCNFQNATQLGNGINGWHGDVHISVGGAMADSTISPAAPIFWCFHAFIDDVYADFLTCRVPVVNRSFSFSNAHLLSDTSHLPSGKVTKNLFKEWSDWSKQNLSELQ